MPRINHTNKRRSARVKAPHLPIPLLAGSAALLLLGVILLWSAGGTSAAGSPVEATSASSGHGWCGLHGQPQCPAVDPGWIAIASESPRSVSVAITGHKVFKAVENRTGTLSLDTPALVHTLAHGGSDYFLDDHWVVSARNSLGVDCVLFDFVFDRPNMRIRLSGFGIQRPGELHYGHRFPYMSPAVAKSLVTAQRRVAAVPTKQPELVFLPIRSDWIGPTASHHWPGGGAYAADPVWMVIGSDGRSYFVGTNSHVYTKAELPV